MEKIKNVVIVGDEETGKTTLANALLGWDIFPQSYDGLYVPTKVCGRHMLTETIRLTDTPGYSLLWNHIPEEVEAAAAQADIMIVMLSEELAEEYIDIPTVDPEWEERRAKEEKLLERLLKGKTRNIYFVIPYETEEWPEGQVPLTQALRLARTRFSRFSAHREDGFFCIDPMQALEGELWADDQMLTASGILPLKAKLMGKDG